MNIAQTSAVSSLPLQLMANSQQPTSASGAFGKVLQNFVEDTNRQQLAADSSVERLATGQSDSIHETVLALTKADLSMRVFMEVRNKVMEAYQDVIKMQM